MMINHDQAAAAFGPPPNSAYNYPGIRFPQGATPRMIQPPQISAGHEAPQSHQATPTDGLLGDIVHASSWNA